MTSSVLHENFAYLSNMKNITFTAEEHIIEAARQKAISEKSSLNAKFREWLSSYVQKTDKKSRKNIWHQFDTVNLSGPKLKRAQVNDR